MTSTKVIIIVEVEKIKVYCKTIKLLWIKTKYKVKLVAFDINLFLSQLKTLLLTPIITPLLYLIYV